MPEFGCDACLPTDPAAAWRARRDLDLVAQQVDQPHFIVSVLECPRCGQRFVSVFTETIDWVGGDDPQRWVVMPISPVEADSLLSIGAEMSRATLEGVPPRRSLVAEHPADGGLRITWSLGIRVPHHD
jgi:hypothetical protein